MRSMHFGLERMGRCLPAGQTPLGVLLIVSVEPFGVMPVPGLGNRPTSPAPD